MYYEGGEGKKKPEQPEQKQSTAICCGEIAELCKSQKATHHTNTPQFYPPLESIFSVLGGRLSVIQSAQMDRQIDRPPDKIVQAFEII